MTRSRIRFSIPPRRLADLSLCAERRRKPLHVRCIACANGREHPRTVAGMTHSTSKPALALIITTAAIALALLAPPALHAEGAGSAGTSERCYDARAAKRK